MSTIKVTNIQNPSSGTDDIQIDPSGNVTIDPLYVDATNNRVGVGTNSPGTNTSNNANQLVVGDNAGAAERGITIGSTTGSSIRFNDGADAGLIEYGHASNFMRFVVNTSTEAARIDSSGNVGIGTTSPGALLDVKASSSRYIKVATESSNGAGLVQCTESAGNNRDIALGGQNVTFCVGAFDSTSRSEVGRFDTSGRLLVGTSSATGSLLEVNGTGSDNNLGVFYARNSSTTQAQCVAAFAKGASGTTTSNVLIKFGVNNYSSGSGQINANGAGACAFGSFSDKRLKENIVDLSSQWENIKNLRPVEFDFIESEGGEHQIGFIAQEFETVYPDAVASSPMFIGLGESSAEERLTLTGWSKTEARLVKVLQEAIAKIETLEAEVQALKGGTN